MANEREAARWGVTPVISEQPLSLKEAEIAAIERVLKETGGNVSAAARLLGWIATR